MSLPAIEQLVDLPDTVCLALRDICAQAAYDDQLIMGMASLALTASLSEFLPVVHHVLRRRTDSAAILARLFAYGDGVDTPTVRASLGDRIVEALLDADVLTHPEEDKQAIRSRFHLRPLEGIWLLADDPDGGRDAVMPPAGTTRQMTQTLSAALPDDTLDVGCGPGSLGLVAALRGARRVVGTDLNPRAIAMARFNARLNGLSGCADFVVGDLTEPVRGQRFGLVMAQPPYVIHPPTAAAVTYLHGGPTGEELPLRLLAELPEVLAPNGRALMLLEAIARPQEPLHARLRPLLGDAPIDLLVLAAPGPPPAIQVLAYASLEAPNGGPAYRAAVHRYLDHLETLGAAEFHHALVVLRAHPDDNQPRPRMAATVPVTALGGGDADALARLLGAIDLAALDADILAARGVSVSNFAIWLEERSAPDPSLQPERFVHFKPGSFGSDFKIAEERYAMSVALSRAASIAAAIDAHAAATNTTPEAVRGDILAFVREGLMRGLFEPDAD